MANASRGKLMRRGVVLAGLALIAACKGGGADQNNATQANQVITPPTRVEGFDWGSPGAELAANPQYARSQALYRAVAGREAPADDRPDMTTRTALRGCDA